MFLLLIIVIILTRIILSYRNFKLKLIKNERIVREDLEIYHFDFIFLQHGKTKDDVSKYIHIFAINFSIIITASI